MALNPRTVRLGLLLFAVLLALATGLLWPHPVQRLDERLHDLGWRLLAHRAADQAEERLVLVDIDEQSLAALGPWPWPRARLAALAERLAAHGVALQVWDLVLDASRPDDDVLAQALRRQRAVLAAAFAFPGQGAPVDTGQLPAAAACTPPFPQAHGQRAPAAAFAGLPVGHIAARVDADGLIRALPAYVCRHEGRYPALALAAWLELNGARTAQAVRGDSPLAPPWRLVAPDLPEAIPLGPRGELLIPYTLPREAFRAVSAAAVLAGEVPAERLRGRVALIGSTALGLGDVVATPLAAAEGGLLAHAQLLAALLDARLPTSPRAAWTLQLAAGAAALALLAWLAGRRLAAYGLPVAGLGLALALLALQLALQSVGLLLGLALPALSVLLAGLLLGSYEALRAGAEGARLWGHLRTYLPLPVAERLARLAPSQTPAAELVEASILVAELRNFTAHAAAHPPAQVAELLQRYFTAAVEVVEAHGGYVEALEGDAVLAVWNGLAPCPDHARQAFAAAQALLRRIPALLPTADPDAIPPPLAVSVGLDSGEVLFGAFGPPHRRQHLALGLPVTRALRLARMTAELDADLLLGHDLYVRLPSEQRAALSARGSFLLEGTRQSVVVHAWRSPAPS